jgi:hypothetical protein
MKTMMVIASLALAGAVARAQTVPLQAMNNSPVLNEWGQPLSIESGALVQFILVGPGVEEPGITGLPHTNNPVVYRARIGHGVVPDPSMAGRFSAAVTPRPGGTIIARVFNAAEAEDASFYADSQPFTVQLNGAIFYPEFGATTNALDESDEDGDGLNASWERSIGTDALSPDSDNDGINDQHEVLAGTNPLDDGDYLQMVQVLPQGDGEVVVRWDSVAGKRYQVQHMTMDLAAPDAAFEDVGPVVEADGNESMITVTNLPGLGTQTLPRGVGPVGAGGLVTGCRVLDARYGMRDSR